ncbi:MAG: choice-of-anchor V domain-containing protein [Candidatus Electryonea clarkiae]|nr:choice-of-anchor V domain-containing protein [Candidatus Electryonea clarkiae]
MNKYLMVSIIIISSVSVLFAYSGGPPDNKCGIPGTNDCTQCHNSFGLNSGDGTLDFTDLTIYISGETYDLSVSLSDEDQSRWGFELAVIDMEGNQAGNLVVSDEENTQLSDNEDEPDFLKQTRTGTFADETEGEWSFQWTAPSAGAGTVTFYIAGNAANNNGNSSGDYIYAINQAIAEDGANVVFGDNRNGGTDSYVISSIFPNPFNSFASITLSIPREDHLTVEVYDVLGQKVETLFNGVMQPGDRQLSWKADGANGIYYLQVISGNQKLETKKMILLK